MIIGSLTVNIKLIEYSEERWLMWANFSSVKFRRYSVDPRTAATTPTSALSLSDEQTVLFKSGPNAIQENPQKDPQLRRTAWWRKIESH